MVKYINIKNKVVLIRKKGMKWFTDETKDIDKILGNTKDNSDEISLYYVYFRKTEFRFFPDNIRIVSFIEKIDTSIYRFSFNNKIVVNGKLERYSGGFFKVTFQNGSTRWTDDGVRIYNMQKIENIYNYYLKTAQYAYNLHENDEDTDPLHFLASNFMDMNYRISSSLTYYLSGTAGVNEEYKGDIIYPYQYNKSQNGAIKTALQNPISVIEGPPGTGKTETILNLICNIVANGLCVAIVSNNNSAVENVIDKFKEDDLDFIIARLGSNDKIEGFFSGIEESDEKFVRFINEYKVKKINNFSERITSLENNLNAIYEAEIKVAKLKDELSHLRRERENRKLSSNVDSKLSEQHTSGNYEKFIERLYTNPVFTDKEKRETAKYFGIKPSAFDNVGQVLIEEATNCYYNAREKELLKLISNEEESIKTKRKETTENRIKEYSLDYLQNKLYERFEGLSNVDYYSFNYKDYFPGFVKRYPVIASTMNSLMNSTGDYYFDYLIIDEASQANLFASVIDLNCARKVVIVGDSKQLQAIGDDALMDESFNLATEMDIPSSYVYNDSNSLLKSVKESVKDVPTTLLREHYRCASDIIRYCNEMFYDGELIPLTNNSEGIHLHIIKTEPGKFAHRDPEKKKRGFYNDKEIDEIVNIVKDWDPDEYGIITPFTLQVEKIRERLGYTAEVKDEDGKTKTVEVESIKKALVSTVHKFQGQQRDKIILSFAVNSLWKKDIDIENRLYDFITNKELLNVAISRAKSELYIVVSDGVYHSTRNPIHDLISYIEYQNGESVDGSQKVFVPDYFYRRYTASLQEDLKKNKENGNLKTSLVTSIDELVKKYKHFGYLMHVRVMDIIPNKTGLREKEMEYLLRPTTSIDFLFYNKVSKEPLFALDLRKEDRELNERERLKKELLEKNKIKLYQDNINDKDIIEKLNTTLNNYTNE